MLNYLQNQHYTFVPPLLGKRRPARTVPLFAPINATEESRGPRCSHCGQPVVYAYIEPELCRACQCLEFPPQVFEPVETAPRPTESPASKGWQSSGTTNNDFWIKGDYCLQHVVGRFWTYWRSIRKGGGFDGGKFSTWQEIDAKLFPEYNPQDYYPQVGDECEILQWDVYGKGSWTINDPTGSRCIVQDINGNHVQFVNDAGVTFGWSLEKIRVTRTKARVEADVAERQNKAMSA